KNLAVRSPYNTYLHAGLPPGPIGQPGRAGLVAALYPADVPFLYFVAQPDGKHIFSATYGEHLAAIQRVKQFQRAARASRRPRRPRAPRPLGRSRSPAPRARRRAPGPAPGPPRALHLSAAPG